MYLYTISCPLFKYYTYILLWCFIRFNSIKSVLGEHNTADVRACMCTAVIIIVTLCCIAKATHVEKYTSLRSNDTGRLVQSSSQHTRTYTSTRTCVYTYVISQRIIIIIINWHGHDRQDHTHNNIIYENEHTISHKTHTLTAEHAADARGGRAEGVYPLVDTSECACVRACACGWVCVCRGLETTYTHTHTHTLYNMYSYMCIITHSVSHTSPLPALPPSPQPL